MVRRVLRERVCNNIPIWPVALKKRRLLDQQHLREAYDLWNLARAEGEGVLQCQDSGWLCRRHHRSIFFDFFTLSELADVLICSQEVLLGSCKLRHL